MMRSTVRAGVVVLAVLGLSLALGATRLSAEAHGSVPGQYLVIPGVAAPLNVANTECAWPGGPLDDDPYAMLFANGAPLRGYGDIDRAAARILWENWHAAGEPTSFDVSPYLSASPPSWVCEEIARQGNPNPTLNDNGNGNDNRHNDNRRHRGHRNGNDNN